MSNISAYDTRLRSLEENALNVLRDLRNTTAPDRRTQYHAQVRNLLNELQETCQVMKREVQLLDSNDVESHKISQQEHTQKLNYLKMLLQNESIPLPNVSDDEKGLLLGTMTPVEGGKDDAKRMAQNVVTIQGTTLGSLIQAERTLNQAEEVSVNATTRLVEQTEQIRNVHDHVEQLDSELLRARKELTEFIQRITTDKIIICFYILIMIGIIILAMLKFMQK